MLDQRRLAAVLYTFVALFVLLAALYLAGSSRPF